MNSPQNIPSHDAISQRAREIWESSGQIDGYALENWLQAEKELLGNTGTDSSSSNDRDAENSQPKGAPTPQVAPSISWKREPGRSVKASDMGKQARAKR
jgi:hypothetical protein